jgi:integral membrane protein
MFDEPSVGEALAGMSPADQLRRKIRITKIIALAEAVSYSLLLVFMARKYLLDIRTPGNRAWLRTIAYVHGFLSIGFAVMVFDIFRVMRWTKGFVVATLLGPPGALLAHWRLRHQPFPTDVRKDLMLF